MSPVRLLRATGDDALARRASRGDEEAFGVLVSRYQVRLELYCRSILRNDEDARDATQNAVTKAWVALRGREQDLAVRAWLFRIAHNESISLIRRRRPTAELGEAVATLAAPAPAAALEVREELTAVLEGIRDLPVRARQALLLRELADLDYASVAQILGITTGGARQAVFEARTALQDDRAGRDEACAEIRRELSASDHRRRPTRKARGHLRGCSACRTWNQSQDTRREHLSLLPGAGLGAWGWIAGLLGGAGAGTAGAGATTTISAGGFAGSVKVLAGFAALTAGAAPVAVHEVHRTHERAQTTTQSTARAATVGVATAPGGTTTRASVPATTPGARAGAATGADARRVAERRATPGDPSTATRTGPDTGAREAARDAARGTGRSPREDGATPRAGRRQGGRDAAHAGSEPSGPGPRGTRRQRTAADGAEAASPTRRPSRRPTAEPPAWTASTEPQDRDVIDARRGGGGGEPRPSRTGDRRKGAEGSAVGTSGPTLSQESDAPDFEGPPSDGVRESGTPGDQGP